MINSYVANQIAIDYAAVLNVEFDPDNWYCMNCNILIQGTTFENNYVTYGGGGVFYFYNNNMNVTLYNDTFTGNYI